MRRPVIGYSILLDDPLLKDAEQRLREPLQQSGALLIGLPRDTPLDDVELLLDQVDGVQLCGGFDIDPAHYGHERHGLTKTGGDPQVGPDASEIELARAALQRGLPILGICRGNQVLAVADGGTLTQDVHTLHPGAHTHTYKWTDLALEPPGEHWHEVVAEPGSAAARWLQGGPSRVNSFHHQCVATTGAVMQPTARTRDGVIEAIERQDGRGWAVGLQWHNEMMWPHDERFLAPHRELVDAARAYAARREGAAA